MNNFARKAFSDSGLTYNDIYDRLYVLTEEITKQLSDFDDMRMFLSRKTDARFIKGTRNIECLFLFVSGPYFKNRECISFNADGFVGFAGWASTENAAPIVNGFLAAIGRIKAESV